MRLNGWQRLGIVASVIWIFVGGFLGNSLGIHEGDWAVSMYKLCLHASPDWNTCSKIFDRDYVEAVQYHWYYAAILAFVPIPIAWLVGWGFVALVRWVRSGFKPSSN
jgi:uncharacterized membrane protein